jgi:hypothetical protein
VYQRARTSSKAECPATLAVCLESPTREITSSETRHTNCGNPNSVRNSRYPIHRDTIGFGWFPPRISGSILSRPRGQAWTERGGLNAGGSDQASAPDVRFPSPVRGERARRCLLIAKDQRVRPALTRETRPVIKHLYIITTVVVCQVWLWTWVSLTECDRIYT